MTYLIRPKHTVGLNEDLFQRDTTIMRSVRVETFFSSKKKTSKSFIELVEKFHLLNSSEVTYNTLILTN